MLGMDLIDYFALMIFPLVIMIIRHIRDYSAKKPVLEENEAERRLRSAKYAGYSLESAENAYLSAKIDAEEYETIVECIMLEAENPQENIYPTPVGLPPPDPFVYEGYGSWQRQAVGLTVVPDYPTRPALSASSIPTPDPVWHIQGDPWDVKVLEEHYRRAGKKIHAIPPGFSVDQLPDPLLNGKLKRDMPEYTRIIYGDESPFSDPQMESRPVL